MRLLETKGVKLFWGHAVFEDTTTLRVGRETVSARNIVIATGSSPRAVLRHPRAIFAENLFAEESPGDKLLIVGAGCIGLEFASLLNNLKKDVLVVEKEENILPFFDSYLSGRLRVSLEKKGIKIETSKNIGDYDLDVFDRVILAAGRAANVSGLGLEKVGVSLDEKGWIKTGAGMRTNIGNIYACGDINGKKQLAYIAEYQAKICVDSIAEKNVNEDYRGIPDCTFTLPQIAKVGLLEDEARQKNIEYKALRSNFLKFSSAYVYDDTDGFIEILTGKNNELLGAGIISNQAADLISLFSLCLKNNLPLEALRNCTFIHPTLSEIIPLVLKESE